MLDETVDERLNALEQLQNNLVKRVRLLETEHKSIKDSITVIEELINNLRIRILEYFQAVTVKLQIALGDFEIELIKEKEREQK